MVRTKLVAATIIRMSHIKTEKNKLIQRGVNLEYITLGWNVVGVAVVFMAAIAARSVALAGFGFDSFIEIFASVIVVWQLKSINKDKERLAERLIGFAFFALAAYIIIQIVIVLQSSVHPEHSPIGIVWLALTAIVMLLLAYGKKKIGKAIPNVILQTEAKVTVIDATLAISVLVGLIINVLFGIWYADLLAALIIVYYGIKEGLHAIRP
jgi:divalent metal cation (Fe/Co/Zn/Cd) transporter